MTLPSAESSVSSESGHGVTPVSRRRALYAGVAAAAALGGAGARGRGRPRARAQLAMGAFAGKPLLLNFWATWCPPCVEELPLLNTFHRENKANGWQVVGLAIDQPSSVRKFLARLPLDFPVGLAGLGGSELGRSLGNLTGGLPFTVVFGAEGRVLHRKMGQVTPQDLQKWVALR